MSATELIEIPVIRITNPFNPREFVHETLVWNSSKPLIEYFPFPSVEMVISRNGQIIDSEDYATTFLDRTDNLVVCPVPMGGSGGKNVLRMIALIAVMVYAPYLASEFIVAGGLGLAEVGVTMAMGTAFVTVAGSLLVNALLPPPNPGGKPDGASTVNSYGVDGAKNTSVEGIPVPICYGKFRMGGNLLGIHVDNSTDDNQILYLLLSAGEGRIASISDVLINDNPIVDFKDVEIQTRLGNPSQTPIPWFNDTVTAHNKMQKLTTDWYYTSTTKPVDKFRLDLVAPQGMGTINMESGDTEELAVPLELEYRPVGSASWLPMKGTDDIVGWTIARGDVNLDGSVTWHKVEDNSVITDPATIAYLNAAPDETPAYDVANSV